MDRRTEDHEHKIMRNVTEVVVFTLRFDMHLTLKK